MDYYSLLKKKVNTLKSNKAEIYDFKINKGIAADKVKKMEEFMEKKIPIDLLEFYSSVNGCHLSWELTMEEESLYGFWDIWPLEKVFFGFSGRLAAKNLENTFEDILWNDYFEEKQISELKTHQVLESIEGESAYVTFKITNGKLPLFYVNEGEVAPIPLDFASYLAFVFESYGVETIREDIQKKGFFKNPLTKPYLKLLNKHIPLNLPVTK